MAAELPDPMIRGERVWLRPLEQRDLEAYRLASSDAETGGLAGFRHPNSVTMVEQWFEQVSEQHGKEGFFFTICLLGSDAFVGTAWLWHLDLVNGSAEFSIFLADKSLWGQGYGTETLNVVLDFGFGFLPLERVALTVRASNERALASYRKAGFTVEGELRHDRRAEGGFENGLLMSILREEWAALPRKKSWES